MNRKYFLLGIIFIFFLYCEAGNSENHIKQQTSIKTIANYNTLWQEVENFKKKGLPKSALEVIKKIYDKAKKENSIGQSLKALLYKFNYMQNVSEETLVKIQQELGKEIKENKAPVKQVLHSIAAEQYWNYYKQNRYRFLKRSNLSKFKQNDMRTWSLTKLVEEVVYHYKKSLTKVEILKKTDISIIDKIIYKGNDYRALRPTLFDFLSHRAIDFFSNTEAGITKPIDTFSLNNKDFLSKTIIFNELNLSTKDPLAFKYYAIKYFQNLIKFHYYDINKEVLIDVNLKRLKFIYSKALIENKSNLYKTLLIDMAKKYKKHPFASEINYELANHYVSLANKYKPSYNKKYRWYNKKAIELCKQTIEKYPNTKGSKNCMSLINTINAKHIDLTLEQVIIPNKPILTLLKYKNINKKIFFKLIKTNNKEKDELKYKNKNKIIKFYNKKPSIKNWNISLPIETDYQIHSTEIKLDPIKPGIYMLMVSNNNNFNIKRHFMSYSFINVSNISYIQRIRKDKGLELYIMNRNTGLAIKNAKAQIWHRKYNNKKRVYEFIRQKKLSFDNRGFLLIPFTDSRTNFSIEVLTKYENVFLKERFNLYKPYDWHQVRTKTFFFTDRAIYRPGQTIYFKGIMLSVDNKDGEKNKILKNYSSTLNFYDVNGQKLNSVTLMTNEFGTFSGSFNIPTGLLNGNMRISNSYGTKYFSVEEYKRPKFEVSFKKSETSYRLNDLVAIKGSAKAFSGYNIDNAKVRYRIIRKNYYPYRWSYWIRANINEMEIKNGYGKTDNKGNFNIKFKAIPDSSIENNTDTAYRYTVFVDIIDKNGETRSARKTISIGNTALVLSINTVEILDMDKNKHILNINSTNLSGEFIKAKGSIKIFKTSKQDKILRTKLWLNPDRYILKENEYNKYFPNDIYDNTKNKIRKGKLIFSDYFDTEKNKTFILKNTINWKTGKYYIELEAKDKYGNIIKDIKDITLYASQSKKLPYKTLNWFVNSKNNVEPGDNAKIIIGSSDKDVRVLFETEYRGKIINRKFIYLNNEQKLIKIPIKEKHRGNLNLNFFFIKRNRSFSHTTTIYVPWTNKKLDISFETFRDKLLPGQKEEWRLRIKGKNGDFFASEMLATLYDSSLDSFKNHNWSFNVFPSHYFRNNWRNSNDFSIIRTKYAGISRVSSYIHPRRYDKINWFGFYLRGYNNYRFKTKRMYSRQALKKEMHTASPMKERKNNKTLELNDAGTGVGSNVLNENEADEGSKDKFTNGKHNIKKAKLSNVKARTNLNETAFFYPHLKTDSKGELIISFTIPEALTKWKMLGFAHTKNLKYGLITNELKTQKELMVIPNAPRFLREKDKIVFASKVTNLTKDNLSGKAQLLLFDSLTMKSVDSKFNNINMIKDFFVKKGESSLLKWNIQIPEDLDTVTWRVVATAGSHSDGEENLLPILKNRMLVTESLPLPLKPEETKTFKFKKLINSKSSKSLKHHKLTLEFTSNPVWYAVQSLPYLMEYPYECLEQTFSRFYANTIAGHIVDSLPEIKRVFDVWKKTKSSNELISKLEKNQELKSLLLEETPWVREAKNETESKKRIALLFDFNRMKNELNSALRKLEEGQMSSGAWPWFKGMRENRYITQHIISGLAHMNALKVLKGNTKQRVNKIVKKSLRWLDLKIREDYNWLIEHDKDLSLNHLGHIQIQYLYARSYYKDFKIDDSDKEAFEYYKKQSIKYWFDYNKYMQGMISLYLNRYSHKIIAKDILKSIKEHAINSDEMGMYWKESYGYNWYRAPVERHALLIEAFSEVLNDKNSVTGLKTWLLKSKQTQNWKTTKATADACFALLLNGDNWLKENKQPDIRIGNIKVEPEKMDNVNIEAGTGYFKTFWNKEEIKPEMGNITIKNNNKITAWGALYWQYFEELDKITPAKTPLSLKKELFVEKNTKSGPVLSPISKNKLVIGDRIKVRIELRVDRDMEYVHMKDMRASGFEPENVISKFKWQDGLGYYESTKDASTNFFIDYLRKGTYIFEYPLRVTHRGDFSNGITSIQCMYAPEFSSHSKGIRVKIN